MISSSKSLFKISARADFRADFSPLRGAKPQESFAALKYSTNRARGRISIKRKRANLHTVQFFPIFLAATLAVMIDSVQLLIDETVVGNLFDDVAFGAINLLEPYLLLEEFFSYLICVGGTALIVRARGAKKPEEMQNLFNHCVTCCLLLGLVFCIVCFLFDESLVTLVAQDSPAYPFALQAFYWDRFYFLICPLYVFLFTYVLYLGGALVDTISMLVMVLVNTGLSVYLGRRIDIAGVTCATFIANCVGILILGLYIMRKNHGFHYRPYVNPGYFKTLTLLGLPESSFFLAIVIMEAGVNALALKYYSIRGVAVVAVLINFYEIVAYASEGISEYETVVANQALGERNREMLQYGMRVTFRAVLIESVVFSLLFLFAAPLIVGTFDINDAETAATAILAVRILAVSPIALTTARVTAIFHQYTNKIGRAILIWISTLGLIPLLFAAFLSHASLEALVWGVALGPVISVALLWIFPFRQKRSAPIDLRRTTVMFGDEE